MMLLCYGQSSFRMVVGQFRVSEAFTEPSAIAPDARINLYQNSVAAHWFAVNSPSLPTDITEVDFSIRRIHHPSGAAPPGTPVRARFCNESVLSHSILTLYGTALIHQTYPLRAWMVC